MNIRCFVGAIVFFSAYGDAAHAIIDIDLSSSNVMHTRQYEPLGGMWYFQESLSYTTPVGLINPGDPIEVRLDYLPAIRLEDFYEGQPYLLGLQLVRGTSGSVSNQSLTSDFGLGAVIDLTVDAPNDGGWLSPVIGGTVQQSVATSLTPTGDFGQFGSLLWTYTAPSWTPNDTEIRLEFYLDIARRDFSPLLLPDPGHDLITFVPEPSPGMLLTSALAGIVVYSLLRCLRTSSRRVASGNGG